VLVVWFFAPRCKPGERGPDGGEYVDGGLSIGPSQTKNPYRASFFLGRGPSTAIDECGDVTPTPGPFAIAPEIEVTLPIPRTYKSKTHYRAAKVPCIRSLQYVANRTQPRLIDAICSSGNKNSGIIPAPSPLLVCVVYTFLMAVCVDPATSSGMLQT
jgi:hypothetical protein